MPVPLEAVPVSEGSRIHVLPEVKALLASDTPRGHLASSWVRVAQALLGENGVGLEQVVAPEVRCFEIEDAGFPQGLVGLRAFRAAINAALPDEWTVVREMAVDPVGGIVETELLAGGTHNGELMGIPPTGKSVEFTIRTLAKLQDGRLIRRWDRTDFAGLLKQLRG